jgi:hypothetical protein
MKWGWKKIDANNHCYNDTWSVSMSQGRWYAVRDGNYCLMDFPDAGAAMAEADLLRERDKLYAKTDSN